MTTARQVGYRALRMLGIIDPEESPTATQSSNMLEALNGMVHAWSGQNVDVGHEDWTLDSDVTVELEPKHVNALVALLAIDLAPEFPGTQVPAAVAKMAADGWAALQAAYFDSSEDSDLRAPSMMQHRRWPLVNGR